MPDRDGLFRHSIYPITFKNKKFAWEKFTKLFDQPDGSLLASLAWERFVPTTELIHAYGCRLAFRINERKKAAGNYEDKKRHVYCGAYQLKAGAIRALQGAAGLAEILSVDVVHHVEEEEIAHTDLRIVLRADGVLNVEGTKTAILDRLWNACAGPLRHICDYDKDIVAHPSAQLIAAPAGPYSDTRSHFFRVWCIVRFHIYSWLWQRRFQQKAP